MDRPVRIAIVGPAQDRLQADLRQLPLRPEVRSWVTLLADAEGLSRYQPDLLAVTFGGTLFQQVVLMLLLIVLGHPVDWFQYTTTYILPTLVYNLVLVVPIYGAVRRVQVR